MLKNQRAREVYDGITKKKMFFLVILIPVLIFAVLVFISTGSISITLPEIFSAILKKFLPSYFDVNKLHYITIWELRMPRIIMGILAGISLAVSGTVMQTILNNPLASPYTLGISSGAGFGASLGLVFGINILPVGCEFFVAANAFLFSLLTCFIIYFISRLKGALSATMVLAGIALMYLFSSLVALVQYFATEQDLQQIVFWLFGSLAKATWQKVLIVMTVVVVIVPLIFRNVWKLTALRLGDEIAEGLGIETKKLRLSIMIYASLLTAVAVCFTGVIGFIGLVAPHIARMLLGEDQRFLLPGSCLIGAILLVFSDTVGKTVISPFVLPVGIITSFIGAPFFLYLILSKKKYFWQ